MTRYFNIGLLVAMIVTAAAVYDRKYDTELAAERVAQLRQKIEEEKNAIQHLKAEWSLLEQPARIQELVERYHDYLKLDTVAPEQVVSIDDLPLRPVDLTPYQKPPVLGGYAEAGTATVR